jgi:hypothetical protein
MDAATVLADLRAAGLTVTIHAGALAVRPASRLTDDLRARIRAHTADLLALLAADSTDGSDSIDSRDQGATVVGCASRAPVQHDAGVAWTCTLCAPAPVLDGPSLPRSTAVCATCAIRHGPTRALALAGLRRADAWRAVNYRMEGGRWRPIPTSAEVMTMIARRATRSGHVQAAHDDGDDDA